MASALSGLVAGPQAQGAPPSTPQQTQQQSSGTPSPGTDGTATQGMGSQQLMQLMGGGGPQQQQGPPGQQQGQQQQPPQLSYQETVDLLHHTMAFQKFWSRLLADPGIGKQDIKGGIFDVMADALNEHLVTLPQVLDQLKKLPTDPLGQRQWVEGKAAETQQAEQGLIANFKQQNPTVTPELLAQAQQTMMQPKDMTQHTQRVGNIVKRLQQPRRQ